jgi:hypothetical protein
MTGPPIRPPENARPGRPAEPVVAAHAAALVAAALAGLLARAGLRLDAAGSGDVRGIAAAAANALGARWARARVRPLRRRPLRAAGR